MISPVAAPSMTREKIADEANESSAFDCLIKFNAGEDVDMLRHVVKTEQTSR